MNLTPRFNRDAMKPAETFYPFKYLKLHINEHCQSILGVCYLRVCICVCLCVCMEWDDVLGYRWDLVVCHLSFLSILISRLVSLSISPSQSCWLVIYFIPASFHSLSEELLWGSGWCFSSAHPVLMPHALILTSAIFNF